MQASPALIEAKLGHERKAFDSVHSTYEGLEEGQ